MGSEVDRLAVIQRLLEGPLLVTAPQAALKTFSGIFIPSRAAVASIHLRSLRLQFSIEDKLVSVLMSGLLDKTV